MRKKRARVEKNQLKLFTKVTRDDGDVDVYFCVCSLLFEFIINSFSLPPLFLLCWNHPMRLCFLPQENDKFCDSVKMNVQH